MHWRWLWEDLSFVKNVCLARPRKLFYYLIILGFTAGGCATSATITRDSDAPARHPFQRFGYFSIDSPAWGASDSFTVPAGKELVIEYLSIRSNIVSGGNQIVTYSLTNTGMGGIGLFSYVPQTTIVSTFGTIGYLADRLVRIYCDPGSTVTVQALRNGSAGSDTVSYTLSGHLIDVP